MNLITDRTSQDVARWRELHDKGLSAMSPAERVEWSGQMKGRYNHTDMNRVENAVKSLSDRMFDLGYLSTKLTVKTDWVESDSPTHDDFARYFGNVKILRDSVAVYGSTPFAPTVNTKLDHNRANDLEKILLDIDEITSGVSKSWYYAGELFSGEV